MDREEAKKIAGTARAAFERGSIPAPLLVRLYSQYHPLKQPQLFVKRASKIFPRLNCGLASAYLRHLLGGRIVQGRYKGCGHTFLQLENGTIVDITADQYGGPKVYVGPLRQPRSLPSGAPPDHKAPD